MNLNPLKKDDNTDALVKALEDANNATADRPEGSTQVAAVPPAPGSPAQVQTAMPTSSDIDESIIAADPQLNGGENPLFSGASSTPTTNDPTTTSADTNSDEPTTQNDDTPSIPSGIASSEESLPEGLSSDADAHLPKPANSPKNEGELDDVKNDALQALRPLIEKLDLEPADKFDKYLMMLRASDDPTLIKPAYEAAVAIEGEKEKAQALLDVINEINYITANKN